MAGDNDELYNDELYGDLDDLDEELVDPDDDPSQQAPAAPAPVAAAPATSAPAQQQPYQGGPPASGSASMAGQPYNFQSDAGPSGQVGGPGGADQGDLDRIRPSDMPDEGKMFIGGLNWETTDDGLKMYMAQYGEIDSCVVMRDPSGRSRGFAFLTYKHPSSVTKVLEQTHHLDGKQIDPKRAIPRAEHERTAKVFVGGLAPSVTSEGLKEFLTQFGQVMDATVMYDKETTRSKGFAFATFSDEEAVTRAMAMSGIELQGKAIEIKRAQPRGSGNLPKQWNNNNARPQGFGGAQGGFDGNAMAAMYQNMKGPGMSNMNMGFDPAAMTMMYQNMLKTMSGMNAPAINPNMARNGMGGMGGMGMGGMGGMGMGMFPMMGMMGGGGMGGMNGMGGGMGGGMGFNNQGGGMGMQGGGQGMGGGAGAGAGPGGRVVPNAPRGPAAMRGAGAPGAGGPGAQGGAGAGGAARQGPGADRYSTQGNSRARPY